ncbi:hypothetical protein ACFE04_002175 [Oxalis oulophora]
MTKDEGVLYEVHNAYAQQTIEYNTMVHNVDTRGFEKLEFDFKISKLENTKKILSTQVEAYGIVNSEMMEKANLLKKLEILEKKNKSLKSKIKVVGKVLI